VGGDGENFHTYSTAYLQREKDELTGMSVYKDNKLSKSFSRMALHFFLTPDKEGHGPQKEMTVTSL